VRGSPGDSMRVLKEDFSTEAGDGDGDGEGDG